MRLRFGMVFPYSSEKYFFLYFWFEIKENAGKKRKQNGTNNEIHTHLQRERKRERKKCKNVNQKLLQNTHEQVYISNNGMEFDIVFTRF